MVEEAIDWHQKQQSRVDTLERSRQFFVQEFKGAEADKIKYLAQIEEELSNIKAQLKQAPAPQPMGQLYRTCPIECEKGIKLLINDLRLFFQIDNMISTDGINALCPLIISEYPTLSLEEITVCFAQAKKGYYGEIYNRLDGPIILKWLRTYHAEKVQRIKDSQQNQHNQSKADINYRAKSYIDKEALNLAYAARELENTKKQTCTSKS